MAAEAGTLNLGTLQGTLILRLDDGTEVEVGTLAVPLNAQVAVTMPGTTQPTSAEPLTVEQIAALPVGAVVRDCDGDTYTRHGTYWQRVRPNGVTVDTRWSIKDVASLVESYPPVIRVDTR